MEKRELKNLTDSEYLEVLKEYHTLYGSYKYVPFMTEDTVRKSRAFDKECEESGKLYVDPTLRMKKKMGYK